MNERDWKAWQARRSAILEARRELGYANATNGPDDRPERVGPNCGTLTEYRAGCDCLACRTANVNARAKYQRSAS